MLGNSTNEYPQVNHKGTLTELPTGVLGAVHCTWSTLSRNWPFLNHTGAIFKNTLIPFSSVFSRLHCLCPLVDPLYMSSLTPWIVTIICLLDLQGDYKMTFQRKSALRVWNWKLPNPSRYLSSEKPYDSSIRWDMGFTACLTISHGYVRDSE